MKNDYLKLIYYTFGIIASIVVVVMIGMKSNGGLSSQSELYYIGIGVVIGFFMKKAFDFFSNFFKNKSLNNSLN